MLLTKIHIPTVGKNTVRRSRLFEKLNKGLKRKLILVSAPAGFGKSTLLSDWINLNKIPTAWFSIDDNDNDAVDFLSYVIAAIQGIEEQFGQSALKLLKSPNQTNPESIVNLLINDLLNINKNFLLVLDDFHLINKQDVFKLVSYFLEHIPENIHVIISTRSDPSLPIARLRSQNQLMELRSSDLSFTADDIAVLFNKKFKIKLSEEDIFTLLTKTEGWIAGLQLTALSMPDREGISKFIQDLKGDNRYIMDYLIEEVLKIQSDDIKEFLLSTSILKQISAPLCNALLQRNDSQIILEKLEKSNMFFFPLDRERKWYRYHHLFADLLKQRLLLKEKAFIKDLHKKAAKWFEDNQMYNLAIEHSLVIKDYEKSIQLLGEVVERMWENGLHSAILSYGNLIPDEGIKLNPEFCLYYSWVLINTGQIKNAKPLLEYAQKISNEKMLSKKPAKQELEHYKKLYGKIAIAFAHLYSNEQKPEEILAYCVTAMENLSDDEPLWLGWAWNAKGRAEIDQGNIRQGIEALLLAIKYGKKSDNLYLISSAATSLANHESFIGQYKSSYKRCSDLLDFMKEKGYSQIAKAEWTYSGLYTMMSVTEALWTDFDKALESVKIAYDLCKNEKNITQKIIALLAYSYILYALEDKKGAMDKLKELEAVMKQYKISPYIVATYVGWKIYLLIESDQIDKANDFVKECGLELNGKIFFKNEYPYVNFARLLIAQHKYDDAESVLSALYTSASGGDRIEILIQVNILYSILNIMMGSREKALRNLVEAMEFASEESLLNYFLFDLNTTKDLLKEVYKIQATEVTKISKQFIHKLKLAIKKKENRARIHSNFDLSSRELDTLKLIAEDLTNQEIAHKLFISLNTVKTHVRNILLKLEVDNRLKAVAKAKKEEIISTLHLKKITSSNHPNG